MLPSSKHVNTVVMKSRVYIAQQISSAQFLYKCVLAIATILISSHLQNVMHSEVHACCSRLIFATIQVSLYTSVLGMTSVLYIHCSYLQHAIFDNLISNQFGLQEELDSILRSLQDSSVSNVRITPSTAHTCTTIVEELAERDRRKRNIVMYNLPEARDRKADKASALNQFTTLKVQLVELSVQEKGLKISTGLYWYALRMWMTRPLYFLNLIYCTERNSLKWSLQLLTQQSLSVKNIKDYSGQTQRKKIKGENLIIRNGQRIARHTPREDQLSNDYSSKFKCIRKFISSIGSLIYQFMFVTLFSLGLVPLDASVISGCPVQINKCYIWLR